MFDSAQKWLNANFLPIILIIVGAWLITRFGGMIISGLIRRAPTLRAHGSQSGQDTKKRQDTLISISSAALKITVWALAVLEVLRRFGIDPTPILAGAGIVGFAVAFGMQSLIKDFVAGLFVIFENQYRVGDIVTLGSATGSVERITIRTTVLRGEDGSVYYIPNGSVNQSVNKTMGYSKLNLSFWFDPKTDVDRLAEIINQVGEKMYHDEKWSKKLLERPHFLNIGSFSDKSVEVKVTGKAAPISKWGVTNEVKKRLLAAFAKAEVTLLPEPSKKEEKTN